MSNVIQKNSISAELVQKMVDAALAKAKAIGVPVNVAILDDGGNLKAFSRMDGAPILSIETAQNKAAFPSKWTERSWVRLASAAARSRTTSIVPKRRLVL